MLICHDNIKTILYPCTTDHLCNYLRVVRIASKSGKIVMCTPTKMVKGNAVSCKNIKKIYLITVRWTQRLPLYGNVRTRSGCVYFTPFQKRHNRFVSSSGNLSVLQTVVKKLIWDCETGMAPFKNLINIYW